MNRYFRCISVFFIASSLLFTACEKDEDDADNTNTETPSTPPARDPAFPQQSDASGVLVGIKTVTIENNPILPFPIEIELGTAVALFPATTGDFSTLIDAGTVSCNAKELDPQSNDSYIFIPGLTDQEGIDFTDGSEWEVSGNSSVMAFTEIYSRFPSTPVVTSGDVDTSTDYELEIESTVGSSADSLYYIIYGGEDYVMKTVDPFTSSVTFTASEMSSLGATSNGLIQVTAYSMVSRVNNGKTYYFVNETVNTKSVSIN